MRGNVLTGARLISIAAVLAFGVACEEEPVQVGRGVAPQAPAPVAPGAAMGDAGVDAGTPIVQYRDEEFAESDTNRDPFRNFVAIFVVDPPERSAGGGREVKLPETGIDEMRVIGVVTGMARPQAMVIDREGVGHVIRRGDYLGRSEVVQVGGTEQLPVTLNWRVDRIRESSVVLVREDPTAPNRPPLTRILNLRNEEEERAVRTLGVRVRPGTGESTSRSTGADLHRRR